jgi:hypothetical protein
MSEFMEGLPALGQLLVDDVIQAGNELTRDPHNQFKRRTFVHFLFAHIEGFTFAKKRFARALYEKIGVGNFTERQIAWLREEAYGQKFPRFEDNFKFSFQAMSAVMGIKFDLNLDRDPRWHSFRLALTIRNRITHPKLVHDMNISDEEILHVMKAFLWFLDKTRALQDILLFYVREINRLTKENASQGED